MAHTTDVDVVYCHTTQGRTIPLARAWKAHRTDIAAATIVPRTAAHWGEVGGVRTPANDVWVEVDNWEDGTDSHYRLAEYLAGDTRISLARITAVYHD